METRKVERIKNEKVEVYVAHDVFSDEECNKFIELINSNLYRSTVVADNDQGGEVSETRTSSSSYFDMNDPFVSAMNERMHRLLPEFIPIELGESLQAQKYNIGELFHDHVDYFDKSGGKGSYINLGNLGQRVWTMLTYLSDVEEGGETEFAVAGLKIKPKKGEVLFWRNLDDDGNGNPDTLHAGRPVKKGVKYIITKWFRDGILDFKKDAPLDSTPVRVEKFEIRPREDVVQQPPLSVKKAPTEPKLSPRNFTTKEDLPLFTEKGFEVIDLPEDIWGYIQDVYKLLEHTEIDEPPTGVIRSEFNENPVGLMSFDQVPYLKKKLHEMIQPIMEEWCGGYELEPATCYGIRSYRRGSVLDQHYDRVEELHVSGIILVDEKSDKSWSWALEIQGHDGKWEAIVIKPGQMILYESATCSHGRNLPFQGEYFRNFFIHYKLKNWTYVPGE